MNWQSLVQSIATQVMTARVISGLIVGRSCHGDFPEFLVLGHDADGHPLAADSLYPVASITKLATALAVLRLAAQGLRIDEPLTRVLPDAAAAQPGVTVRTLLCHTAGLPGDLAPAAAPYAPGLDWPALARACLATPLAEPPHTQVRYSNVGPGLLAVLVERVTGQPFNSALAELVLAPLGIEGYLGVEPPRPAARVAGGLGEHAGTALEPFNSTFWRSMGFPWGGLVTTAAGALRLVQAFTGAVPGFLPPQILAEATRDQTDGLGGGFWPPLRWDSCPWGLGVELRGAKTPHWTPAAASPGSFGHVGASGVLAWCDPAADIAWVILGTRTFETWWMDWPGLSDAVLAT
jgi:beta-lactamase class C